jgi:hypothetical protein
VSSSLTSSATFEHLKAGIQVSRGAGTIDNGADAAKALGVLVCGVLNLARGSPYLILVRFYFSYIDL